MGAWNYTTFDDDTAYDVLDDLRESENIVTDMEHYFDQVIGADYVEYEEAHYALVSAAIIDCLINDTPYRCDDEEFHPWVASLKHLEVSFLKDKAIKAIEAIVSDHSELKELWEENEELYPFWREDKKAIQKRLHQENKQ